MIQRPFQMEATDKKNAVMNDSHSRAVGSQYGVEYTNVSIFIYFCVVLS
jgi:hypothetical protein